MLVYRLLGFGKITISDLRFTPFFLRSNLDDIFGLFRFESIELKKANRENSLTSQIRFRKSEIVNRKSKWSYPNIPESNRIAMILKLDR